MHQRVHPGVVRVTELLDILACPRCRQSIRSDADGSLRCANPACVLAAISFPVVSGQPVLVDFDASVLDRETVLGRSGVSLIDRGGTGLARSIAARLSGGKNLVAERRAREIVSRFAAEKPCILVIGGGTIGSGAEPLYESAGVRLVAFDVYASSFTSFVADAHAVPLMDASVDGVWIQAVLEHVLDPHVVVAEIQRVLKRDGWVYAETPFMQHVHEGPYDFTRFTHSGQRWLFRHFTEIESGVVLGAGTQLLWAFEHFVRALTRSRAAGKAARLGLFWLRWFDRLGGERQTLDAASSLYMYAQKNSREPFPAVAMPAYYRGADHRATRPGAGGKLTW